jgi:phosphohistidine phosphatase
MTGRQQENCLNEIAEGRIAAARASQYRLLMAGTTTSTTATRSRIFMLRHARAAWAAPGGRDFDRALDEEGRNEAHKIGLAMAINGYAPESVLCSTARRCRETLAIVAPHLGVAPQTAFEDILYSGEPEDYIDRLRLETGATSVLVIGHNPMMETTTEMLLGFGRHQHGEAVPQGFPTAGLAVIDLDGPLSLAGRVPARLTGFLSPGDV